MKKLIILSLSIFCIANYAIGLNNNQSIYFHLADNTQQPDTSKIFDIVDDDTIYRKVDVMPKFPGGDEAMFKFLRENLLYPQKARENKIQGKVIVRFVVTRTGQIDGIDIASSPNQTLSEEATRVIKKMPEWIPGQNKGEKVNCYTLIPITFMLH